MADVYDEWFGIPGDAEDADSFLAELAGRGPALELGIGTGRVALPLAERGIEVHGIDASEAMVERLRAKPGGAGVSASIGDFADVGVEGRFSLVYVVFNTFFALLSQEDQALCLANVAQRLEEEGVFVVEAFVPDPTRLAAGQVTQNQAHRGGPRLPRNVSLRHCPPARLLSEHLHVRDGDEVLPGANALRLAFGDGSHGLAGGPPSARAFGRLASGAVYGVEWPAHLGLRKWIE
jgi:SAM-dependent methyltransferase